MDCEVLVVDPNRALSHRWDFTHDDAAFDLRSIMTFTLEPTRGGTRLRMEQSGFQPDQKQAFGGASAGWHRFFEKLDQVLEESE